MVTIIAVGAVLFCCIALLGRFLDRHATRHATPRVSRELTGREHLR